MRRSTVLSLVVVAILMGFAGAGVTYAAVTVDGPYEDVSTQGDWTQTYNGDPCFYLLPTPPPQKWTEFPLNTTDDPNVCEGGSFIAGNKLTWDMFSGQDQDPKPIYVYYFDPLDHPYQTGPGADQWNPCANGGQGAFYGATFDNGDTGPQGERPMYEPLVSEVTVDYTGSFRIAYYFLEDELGCREQKYKLFVNGELKAEGMVADFGSGKYAYFGISGLSGTSTIRFEVLNTKANPDCNYGNVHFSGIFIDQCNNQFQGCTPGYWKQSQHFDSWTNPPYWTNTKFSAVFERTITVRTKNGDDKKTTVTDPTLLQALNAEGGCINAIARHAVAALLNAASGEVSYLYSTAEVISKVRTALDSGDCNIIGNTKDLLDSANNAGCSLN